MNGQIVRQMDRGMDGETDNQRHDRQLSRCVGGQTDIKDLY